MANNETKVLTTNSFEEWRRASNEVSYHLGDVDQFDSRIGDKTYTYSASADQQFFIGADSGSKILRFELVAEVPIDVTSTIIFDHITPPTIGSNWVTGKTIYQGSVGSETFTGVILYVNKTKVALTSTTGTFSASADLKQTTDSTTQTIAHADLIRSFSESYTTSYAKVYNASTEQSQSTAQVGFHVPNLAYTIVLNGTPAVLASFSEGAKVYQGTNWGSRVWEGTILKTTTGNVYLKSYSEDPRSTGTTTAFSATTMLKEESDSGSDRIIAARITSGAAVDTTFGTIIELHTLASASDAIKLVSTGAVDAIKELQDDIGTVENLTTTATDVVTAINEIEAVFDASTKEISAGSNAFTVTSGNFTLDSSGDIVLDAGGADIIFKDDGTTFGQIIQSSNNLEFHTSISDGDFVLKGSDGGSTITALTLDMSDLGAATFNNDVNVGVNLDVTGTGTIDGNFAVGADKFNVIASSGNTQIDGTLDVDGNLEVGASKFNVTAASGNTQIDGTLEVDGATGIDGDLRVGSDKFNVTASSGNTQIDGNLEVDGTFGVDGNSALVGSLTVTGATVLNGGLTMDTNKFTVADTTGNTLIGGTLGVTGVVDVGQLSATFTNRNNVKLALNELMADLGDVTASNMGTSASTVVTAISELHTDVDASVRLTSGSAQTLNFDMTYGSNGKSMTFASGTTLDLSNATLLLSAAGNVANFGSAFLNLDATEASGSNVNLQGLQVDRSSISGGAPTHDVRLQWDETRVANDPEEAWELQGMATDKSSNTSSIVTRYNAFNLFNGSTQTGLGFTWDDTNERFNVVLDNSTFALTGDITGSASQTAKGNVSIATTLANDSVDLTTHTTGNYVATITGTANEITVSGSGTEGRAVTLALPDDVTIGDDLTVTDALSVGGNTTLTGNLNVNGNTTLGNQSSDTVSIPGNMTITGDLTVNGTNTILNTSTIEVEDTLVLAGNNLTTEPTTGGFGIEAGPVITQTVNGAVSSSTSVTLDSGTGVLVGQGVYGTGVAAGAKVSGISGTSLTLSAASSIADGATLTFSHTTKASNVTGSHSIVYNYNTDRWEADGSLILSNATNTPPTVESNNFGAGTNLDFVNGTGITAATSVSGADIDVLITNTDRGSQQNIWKTITADSGGSAAANSNTDTLTISGGTSLASARSGDTITVNHNNIGAGAATYGPTGSVTGVYIKSVIVDAQGHVTAVTTDDFDSRYAPIHETHPGDDISLDTGTLTGATVISDIDFNIDTNAEGHVTDATLTTLSTRNLSLFDLADTDWGTGVSEPADAAVAIYDQTSNTWRDYALSGDVTMNDVGATVVADNSHSHTYSNISDPPTIGNATLTITAGTGLSGGGTFTANATSAVTRTLAVDLNELGTETSIADADFIAMVDATDGGSQKITFENLEDAIFASVSGDVTITEAGVATVGNDSHTHSYTNLTNKPTTGDGAFTTKDFTVALKNKLDGIATSANNYSLPFSYTSANTANNVVQRDGSGNFSAGTITATFSGNASSATKLATARNIGGVAFDGTGNINLPGVNTTGSQNTSGSSGSCTGNAVTATTADKIVMTDHDGNASYPLVHQTAANTVKYDSGVYMNASSNIVYATDFIASSDERQKDIIEPITGALDKVCAIDGFIYKWNDKAASLDKETRQVGISAQAVQAVLPEAVNEKDDGYLGVAYDKLVPLLIESIKELKSEVEELKRINS